MWDAVLWFRNIQKATDKSMRFLAGNFHTLGQSKYIILKPLVLVESVLKLCEMGIGFSPCTHPCFQNLGEDSVYHRRDRDRSIVSEQARVTPSLRDQCHPATKLIFWDWVTLEDASENLC